MQLMWVEALRCHKSCRGNSNFAHLSLSQSAKFHSVLLAVHSQRPGEAKSASKTQGPHQPLGLEKMAQPSAISSQFKSIMKDCQPLLSPMSHYQIMSSSSLRKPSVSSSCVIHAACPNPASSRDCVPCEGMMFP